MADEGLPFPLRPDRARPAVVLIGLLVCVIVAKFVERSLVLLR